MTKSIDPLADLATLTADVVSAYVSNNSVAASDLPGLIAQVYGALTQTVAPTAAAAPAKREPAVSIKKSVTPNYITSLLDGKQYKSLKRHLSSNGMTPDEYRTEFGLPKDYPMVAASYSAQRSTLAKSFGLGRKPALIPAPVTRGRKKAA